MQKVLEKATATRLILGGGFVQILKGKLGFGNGKSLSVLFEHPTVQHGPSPRCHCTENSIAVHRKSLLETPATSFFKIGTTSSISTTPPANMNGQ